MAKNKSTNELSGGCLALFGLPFLGAGLFLSWLYFSGYVQWMDARSWEETPCWIESAELKTSRGKSTTYRATATYRYEYRGRVYRGDRVAFGGGADNVGRFQQNAHRELARHVVGKPAEDGGDPRRQTGPPFRCFVNPADPSESVLFRTLRWEMQAFMAVFVLTFPAIGAGLVFGGWFGALGNRRETALRECHPGEPWKWKSIWSGPSIPESAGQGSLALHLYTFWSGLVVITLVAATVWSGAFQRGSSAWLVLIFVGVWTLPAWFCSKRIRHRLAVGATCFEPKETPASPGGLLHGAILLEKPLPLRGTPEIRFFCEKTVTRGSGRRRSATTEEVWSHQEIVAQDLVIRDLTGFRLPVGFSIPADVPESDAGGDSDTAHTWNLELKVPGTAIHSIFELPVFHASPSAAPRRQL